MRALVFRGVASRRVVDTEKVWGLVILLGTLIYKNLRLRDQQPVPFDRCYDPPYPVQDLSIGVGLSFGEDKHGYVP